MLWNAKQLIANATARPALSNLENITTYYINSINQINDPLVHESKNEQGKITFFSSCLPHYTDTHMADEERISMTINVQIINKEN